MPLFELHRIGSALGLPTEGRTPHEISTAILAEFAMLRDAVQNPLAPRSIVEFVATHCKACGREECDGAGEEHDRLTAEREAAQRTWDIARGALPPESEAELIERDLIGAPDDEPTTPSEA